MDSSPPVPTSPIDDGDPSLESGALSPLSKSAGKPNNKDQKKTGGFFVRIGKPSAASSSKDVGDDEKSLKDLVDLATSGDWTNAKAQIQVLAKAFAWPQVPMSDADFAKQNDKRDTLLGVNGSVPALVALLKSGAPEVVLPAIKLILTFVQGNFKDRPLTPPLKRIESLVKANIVPTVLDLLNKPADDGSYGALLRPVANLLWGLVEHPLARESFVNSKGVELFAKALNSKGKDFGRESVAGVLQHLALDEKYFDAVAIPEVLSGLVLACHTLDIHLNRRAIIVLKSFSTNPKCAENLLALKAHEWLIPLISSTDSAIAFLASCLIIDIREGSANNRAVVDASGALDEVERFLHAYDVSFFSDTIRYRAHKIVEIRRLLAPERDSIVRLCGGWQMLGCCVTIPKVTEMKDLLSDKATVQAITSLCQSSDVWLYQLGVQCLRRINKFIPKFNGTSQQLTMRMERPLKQWNEDDVARWAAEQRFNTYAPLFQNGWVDGDLLLALNDSDLEKMGIANPMHRKRILRSIQEADKITESQSKARLTKGTPASGDLVLANSNASSVPGGMPTKYTYDVFISYRRSNGSQLSQLIKIHLKLAQMNVFLDVDELGAGEFDTHLLQNLQASRCFVLILTKGALDRCLLANQTAGEVDWVQREIATALIARKTIIPVVYEFTWPTAEQLPADIRSVVTNNGVNWSHEYMDAAVERIVQYVKSSQ